MAPPPSFRFGNTSDSPPTSPQKSGGAMRNLFGGNHTTSRVDESDVNSGGFSVQEQSPANSRVSISEKDEDDDEKGNRVCGSFGRKKRGSETKNVFATDDDNRAVESSNNHADFDAYASDEPPETQGNKDPFKDHSANSSSQDESWDHNNAISGAKGQEEGFFDGSISGSEQDDDSRRYDEDSGSRSESYVYVEEDDFTHDSLGSRSTSRESKSGTSAIGSESYVYVEEDDFTRDSRGTTRSTSRENKSGMSAMMPEGMRHLDAMVDKGDWDGVMEDATDFESRLDEDGSGPSSASQSKAQSNVSDSQGEEDSDLKFEENHPSFAESSDYDDESVDNHSASLGMTSEELRRQEQYRVQVEALVRKCVPAEIDNISNMMDQFAGRERDLINALQTLYERSASLRARKAVHRSRGIPDGENRHLTSGAGEGNAASTIGGKLRGLDPQVDPPK